MSRKLLALLGAALLLLSLATYVYYRRTLAAVPLDPYALVPDDAVLVLATRDGCLVRRFFHPGYLQTNAYHLRIPTLLLPLSTLPSAACCAQCHLRQAAAASLMRVEVAARGL